MTDVARIAARLDALKRILISAEKIRRVFRSSDLIHGAGLRPGNR
jgi:hypothetical protein